MANNVAPIQDLALGTQDATTKVVTGVTTGQSKIYSKAGAGIISVALRSTDTTSGGTIVIEECLVMPGEVEYAGTWSAMQTVSASSFTGGAQKVYHFSESAYGQIRIRISSDITGGGKVAAIIATQGSGS